MTEFYYGKQPAVKREIVELVVDFHTATIQNEQIGTVQSHKYIENPLNSRLDWQHSEAVEENLEQPVLSEGAVRDVLLYARKEDGGAIGDRNKQFTKYMLPTAAIRRCKVSSPALRSMLLAVTAVGSNANKQAYILLFLDPLAFRLFCVCDAIALCVLALLTWKQVGTPASGWKDDYRESGRRNRPY